MKLNLSINGKSQKTIVNSFDRIANDLITGWQLNLQGVLYSFTEIEFYYFHKLSHPDKYSHKHSYDTGKWRFHLQGLDISLGSESENDNYMSYGGILIRGIKSDTEYINGPKRILAHIFKQLDEIEVVEKQFGLIPIATLPPALFKSFRKGLSDRYPDFSRLHYRYYHSIEQWDDKHVPPFEKKAIIANAVRLS